MKKRIKNKSAWRAALGYIGKYKLLLVLSLLLSACSVAATLYIPILVGGAIDDMLSMGAQGIVGRLAAAAVLAAAGGLVTWLAGIINNRICYNVVRNARNEAFEHLQRVPLSYIDSRERGDIISRITSDAEQLGDGLLLGFTQLFTGVLTVAGTLGFMLALEPVIAAAVAVLTPISLLIARFIARRTHSLFIGQSEARAAQTAFVEEMLTNRKVVAAFSQQEPACQRFGELNEQVEKTSRTAAFFSSLVNPSTRFVNAVVYAAVTLIGALAAIRGQMTVGTLSCLLSYANQYAKPFNEISSVLTELQNALACAERLFELQNAPLQSADGPLELNGPARVSMDNVCFSYVPSQPLIRDFSLEVPCGSRVAIVGPTGCGKTTLINLLMRFYDPQSGSISMNGINATEISRASLRGNIGMVLQDTWLCSGTVRENIALGRPEASDEEIEAAARFSHAHEFIVKLPKGYDTVISDSYSTISAGQKQLLCIARVMLSLPPMLILDEATSSIDDSISQGQKQLLCISRVALALPPMLILDEATSSIDTRTEMKIQDAFARMMQGRTCFIVAHRLSTIRNADIILVMKDGNIVEQGTHAELMERRGFYYQLNNA